MCVWCKRRGVQLSLDHFLPRELGGGNEADNLITSCLLCNSKRQHKPALTFALEDLGNLFGDGFEALERAFTALAAPLPTHCP